MFVFKENQHITVVQVYAQPLMPKKLTLNNSMKKYKNFYNEYQKMMSISS